jgi:hypothetical protein
MTAFVPNGEFRRAHALWQPLPQTNHTVRIERSRLLAEQRCATVHLTSLQQARWVSALSARTALHWQASPAAFPLQPSMPVIPLALAHPPQAVRPRRGPMPPPGRGFRPGGPRRRGPLTGSTRGDSGSLAAWYGPATDSRALAKPHRDSATLGAIGSAFSRPHVAPRRVRMGVTEHAPA